MRRLEKQGNYPCLQNTAYPGSYSAATPDWHALGQQGNYPCLQNTAHPGSYSAATPDWHALGQQGIKSETNIAEYHNTANVNRSLQVANYASEATKPLGKQASVAETEKAAGDRLVETVSARRTRR